MAKDFLSKNAVFIAVEFVQSEGPKLFQKNI